MEILRRLERELQLSRQRILLADVHDEVARRRHLLEERAVVRRQLDAAVLLDEVREGLRPEATFELPGRGTGHVRPLRDLAFEELGEELAESRRRGQLREQLAVRFAG